MHIPRIDDYLKSYKDSVAINFSECFNSTKKTLYSKLNENQNLWKVDESLYIFLATPDKVENYAYIMKSNSSHKYVHRYNIEILSLFYP